MTTLGGSRPSWDDRRLEAAFAARAASIETPTDVAAATLERVRTARRPAPAWARWLPAAAVVLLAVGLAAGAFALGDRMVGRDLFRPGPTADLKTLDTGEFAFEYPARWLAYDAATSFSGGSATAVLGTLPVEPRCGDERHVDINCVYEQRLEAGHIRLIVGTGSYRGGTIEGQANTRDGTWTRLEVGGMPAIFIEGSGSPDSYYREDASLHWEIARPGSDGTSVVEIEALLTNPGVTEARAQLDALIASFRFANGPDPSVAPTPVPSPTEAAPRLADLRVMTVEELIAAAEDPTPEEVIVRGWLLQTGEQVKCFPYPARPCPAEDHPLIPVGAEHGLHLAAERPPGEGGLDAGASSLVPVLRRDAHVAVRIGTAVEVQAIGHLLDHRWTTCPAAIQAECRSRFVIDRVVGADQPLDDDIPTPWAIPNDHSVDGAADAVDVVRSVVGGITVVSIGVADAEPLRGIEPSVGGINNGEGAWVIRALVAGEAEPVARTFLVGHIGWFTLYEVTEAGLLDRTPPVEGAPTPAPTQEATEGWPPAGVLDVAMPEGGTGLTPHAGVIDRTGLLLEARAAGEADLGWGVAGLASGEMAVVQAAPDTIIAYWDGTLCDDRLVLTVYADRPGDAPDRLELRGDRADLCRLARVHYGMVLRFSQAIDATTIHGWERVGTPYETFPPVDSTVVFLAKDGGFELPKFRAAFVDLSGRVTGVRAPRADDPRPIDPNAEGPVALLPDPEVAGRFHLYWTGGICDDEIVVTIDASMTTVTVDGGDPPPCDAMGVERRLVIDVDGALDPNAIELRYTETGAGAS